MINNTLPSLSTSNSVLVKQIDCFRLVNSFVETLVLLLFCLKHNLCHPTSYPCIIWRDTSYQWFYFSDFCTSPKTYSVISYDFWWKHVVSVRPKWKNLDILKFSKNYLKISDNLKLRLKQTKDPPDFLEILRSGGGCFVLKYPDLSFQMLCLNFHTTSRKKHPYFTKKGAKKTGWGRFWLARL